MDEPSRLRDGEVMEWATTKFTDTLKKNYEFRRLYNKGKSAVTP